MATISVEIINVPVTGGPLDALREKLRQALIACAGTKMRSKTQIYLAQKPIFLGGELDKQEQIALGKAVFKDQRCDVEAR